MSGDREQADGDAEEAPSKPAVSAGADPIANQFLRQIRFFEEQFNASLEPDEKRIVDTVLKDSFTCDLSLAAWWEKVRKDWENRDFVAHVDALHPNLSQT